MEIKNLTIIGSSHIAKQSLEEVEKIITKLKPIVVAVELDRKRYDALISGEKGSIRFKNIKVIGLKGYLFALLGSYAEKKLGKIVGVSPGSEMLKAIEIAKANGAKVALIDQDIVITLRRFSQELTWKEKWRFFADLIKGILMPKREMKKLGIEEIDLTKVPEKEIVKKLTDYVKQRYPNVHKVLIEERNTIMANRLLKIIEYYEEEKIVAVVGAGHVDEIAHIIKQHLNKEKRE
ncbi:MAG: TraB/GumN family protein [Candidatus Woesearchaeota archaeon]